MTTPSSSSDSPGPTRSADDVRLREALGALPAYVPGKPAPVREGQTAYKVSSNENPYPPLKRVRKVIERAAREVNRYPDMAVTELTAAIAEAVGVETSHVATGTGSVGVLGQIIQATCDAGDEVVYAWRSFEAYPIVTALAGATSVRVGLDAEARHRLDAMLAAVTDRTKVVIICSPNNPTGPAVRERELRRFMERVPSSVLVVFDEAYLEFVTDPEAPDAIQLWREYPNLVVLRTFSKAYGLAGLRVGYAVAHDRIATALRQTAVPFGVSSIAQAAAVASLRDAVAWSTACFAASASAVFTSTAVRSCSSASSDMSCGFVFLIDAERSKLFLACSRFACDCASCALEDARTASERCTAASACA